MLDILVLLVTVFLLIAWLVNRPRNLPPGPVGLPLVGVIPWLTTNPGKWYHEVAKKYGDVISVRLGSNLAVILHGYDAVKEAFVENRSSFSGRPDNLHCKVHNGEVLVVRQTDYEWKMRRTLFKTAFRQFGLGNDNSFIENRVLEEMNYMYDFLDKTKGQVIDCFLSDVMTKVMNNINSAILLGKRVDYDDLHHKLIHENGVQIQRSFRAAGVINVFPFLWRFPIAIKKQLLSQLHVFHRMVEKYIDAHQRTLDPSSPRDVLDIFLTKRDYMKEHKPSLNYLDDPHLPDEFGDVVRTSTETTGSSLTWIFMYMAQYQDVQRRVQKEIDTAYPEPSPIRYSDRDRLPYSQACIHEALRHTTLVPVGLAHATSRRIRFRGFDIPANTMVFANMYSMHQDERYWSKPGEFNPQRWLQDDGRFGKSDLLAHYSYGPRVCLGKDLAQSELFLVFANVMKHFSFKPPDDKEIDFTESITVINAPKTSALRVERR
ncbi:vitamin D 25-hydroxylase-like [Ptychodera flava]|uniref:vitamin D 25-hydroxylase-like n=1 Tax=Ptychodera flava TaxID=63121 RepID=UPI003969D3CE